MSLPIRTDRFRVPRFLLARLAAEEYVRAFWWFVLPVPLFGLISTIFATGIMQVIGFFALMWPLTIPMRAVLITSKAGRMLERGVVLSVEEDALYFLADEGKGMKLDLEAIRDVALRHGYFIARLRKTGFVLVPVGAFQNDADRTAFLETVRSAIETRLSA